MYLIDISKPFSLFGSNIRLKTHERLNVLERETVQIMQQKIKDLEKENEFYRE